MGSGLGRVIICKGESPQAAMASSQYRPSYRPRIESFGGYFSQSMDSARSCSGVICPIGGSCRSLTGARSAESPPHPATIAAPQTITANHSDLAGPAARPLRAPAVRHKSLSAVVQGQGLGWGYRIPFH